VKIMDASSLGFTDRAEAHKTQITPLSSHIRKRKPTRHPSRSGISTRTGRGPAYKALCFFTRHLPDSKGILRGFVSKSDAEKADAVTEAVKSRFRGPGTASTGGRPGEAGWQRHKLAREEGSSIRLSHQPR
jgi:hypothetical protein